MSSEAENRYRNFEHGSWERAAQHYTDSFGTFTAPFARPLLDAVGCSAGTQILEIASGTGYISQLASILGATAAGVDFSAAMVAEAKTRCLSASFSEADAEDLPFGAESFDAVVIGFGVHHFPSPRLAVSEARRVLRIGGRFAFTVWSSSDNKIQQVLIDGITESGLRGSALPTPPNGDINSVETCIRLLSAAGFGVELSSARKLKIGLAVPSAQRLLEITARSTARGAAMIRAQPEHVMPAVIASVERAMDPYRCPIGQGYEVPAVAILAVATRY
jgi:SAM-dependent methyltransferase